MKKNNVESKSNIGTFCCVMSRILQITKPHFHVQLCICQTVSVRAPTLLSSPSQLPDSASPLTLQAAGVTGGVASPHSPSLHVDLLSLPKTLMTGSLSLWPWPPSCGRQCGSRLDRTGQAPRSPLQHWSGRFLHKATAPPAQLGATLGSSHTLCPIKIASKLPYTYQARL